MITAHRTRKPQKAQAGGPHGTNIPAQAQHPSQHLPASEIRVPYQSSAPPGQEAVQCRGFGEWLREIFCCGDSGVTQISGPTRADGPCAMAALELLGWYSSEDDGVNRIQTAQFGELGIVVNDIETLRTMPGTMILFLSSEGTVPFHVMYTDGEGNLCGVNNSQSELEKRFEIIDYDTSDAPVVKLPLSTLKWRPEGTTILKCITYADYQWAKQNLRFD